MSERRIVFTLLAIQTKCSASTIFRKFLLPGALSNEIEVHIGSIILICIEGIVTSKLFIGGYPRTARIQPSIQYAAFEGEVEELVVGDVPVGLWNFVEAENIYGAVERDKLKSLQQSIGYRFIGEGYATLDRRSHRFHDRVDVQLNN